VGRLARNRDDWHTYGVEVTPSRVVWFLDGRSVAVLPQAAAAGGTALVPRIALRGQDGVAMSATRVNSDWVRYYPLDRPDGRRITGVTVPRTVSPDC